MTEHQWEQVDYREIWEKQAYTLVTNARTIPKGGAVDS
jgi:hypothetical protein